MIFMVIKIETRYDTIFFIFNACGDYTYDFSPKIQTTEQRQINVNHCFLKRVKNIHLFIATFKYHTRINYIILIFFLFFTLCYGRA